MYYFIKILIITIFFGREAAVIVHIDITTDRQAWRFFCAYTKRPPTHHGQTVEQKH